MSAYHDFHPMEKTAILGTIGRAAWNVVRNAAPNAVERASTMATRAMGGVRTAFQPVMQNGVAGLGQTFGNIGTGIGNAAGYMVNGLRGAGVAGSRELAALRTGLDYASMSPSMVNGGMRMVGEAFNGGLNNPFIRTGLAYGTLGTAGMMMV